MSLVEKLELLNLSKEEEKRALEKFIATLSLLSEEEIKSALEYLRSMGVYLTKGSHIKVLGNSVADLKSKFGILSGEIPLFIQDPNMLNKNVIDIYKKIQYCIQNGIEYKNVDGTYMPFLFSEALWQKQISDTNNKVVEEPKINDILAEPVNNEMIDIKDYVPKEEIRETIATPTSFDAIRNDLEAQLAELAAIKDEISFGEYDPNYSERMGRAA